MITRGYVRRPFEDTVKNIQGMLNTLSQIEQNRVEAQQIKRFVTLTAQGIEPNVAAAKVLKETLYSPGLMGAFQRFSGGLQPRPTAIGKLMSAEMIQRDPLDIEYRKSRIRSMDALTEKREKEDDELTKDYKFWTTERNKTLHPITGDVIEGQERAHKKALDNIERILDEMDRQSKEEVEETQKTTTQKLSGQKFTGSRQVKLSDGSVYSISKGEALLMNPEGQIGKIKRSQYRQALKEGYRPVK
jgi:hypothetical protein